MIRQWIHINFELEGGWVNRVWAAYHASPRMLPAIPPDARELAVHVATRLSMLPRLGARLNSESAHILRIVKGSSPGHVSERGKPGGALDIDNDLKFCFLLDVDALFFEINALCEIMGRFVARIHELAGLAPDKPGKMLKRILEDQGSATGWFADLDRGRNLFIHSATPYLAVDVTDAGRPELVILKESADELSEAALIRMSSLDAMVRGFGTSVQALEQHLTALLAKKSGCG